MAVIYRSVLICFGLSVINAITTIHHDKPESVIHSTIQISGKTAISSPYVTAPSVLLPNVTLTPSERKKRLLPYENFYFEQPFNRPQQSYFPPQYQYKDYEDVGTVNKKPPRPKYEPIQFRPKTVEVLYHPGQKFTPFMESNALPGSFRPILKNTNHQSPLKLQYTLINHSAPSDDDKFLSNQEKVQPNFSAIYDKLAQLKLRQQEMRNKIPYGYRLVPSQRYRDRLYQQKPNGYQALNGYEPGTRYKIQPSKTTIETFIATNIDVPTENVGEKYEYESQRYHQIQTPTKEDVQSPARLNYGEKTKPFVNHQIAIEVPESSLPLTFRPTLRKPPIASGNQERPRKPSLVYFQDKPGDRQQQILIFRKPKPVVEENYVAEKFVPIQPPKTYHSLPIYVPQEPQYEVTPSPVYDTTYEPQYQVTPAPLEQHEYQSVTPTAYEQEYHSAVTPGRQHPEYQQQNRHQEYQPVVTPVSHLNEPNGYYRYQTVSPANVSPVSINDPVGVKENVVPEYPEQYHVTPQSSSLGSSEETSNSLALILKQLQESNTLPQTLTPDNIDNSIKTLVKILDALRSRQKQTKPVVVPDEYEEDIDNEAGVDLGGEVLDTPDGGTPGKPGVDYPALSTIPKTSFSCKTQRYKGFFGDPDTNCQVWHYCDLNGGQASFLCPNGTIFSQVALTCDWWYNVKCASTAQLYVLNERLYKYIIPLSPKFPEDYSGPLVDKYLAIKFQEMEEKLRKQKKGKGNSSTESDESEENSEETDTSGDETHRVEDTETTKPTTEDAIGSDKVASTIGNDK